MYVRNLLLASLSKDPQLNIIQGAVWLRADIGSENLFMGCAIRPLGPCGKDVLLLADAINCSCTLLGPEVVAGYFNTPYIFWFIFIFLNSLLPFVAHIQPGAWIKHVADPTRKNILSLIFTIRLIYVRPSVKSSSPGCDRLLIS